MFPYFYFTTTAISTAITTQIPLGITEENRANNCQNIEENVSEQKTFPIYAKVDKRNKKCALDADQVEIPSENHTDGENTSGYESLRSCQSYEGLTHQIQFYASGQFYTHFLSLFYLHHFHLPNEMIP